MEKKIKVMAIGAHADEAHGGCGATLKFLSDLGCECVMLHVANHNHFRTPEELKEFDKNMDNAAQMLGCRHIVIGDRGNRLYEGGREDRELLIEQLRLFQPEIVFLQWPKDSHPEHRRVAQCAYDAILNTFWNQNLSTVREIYAWEAGPNQSMYYFYPDFYISYDEIADTVLKAMEACFPGDWYKLANVKEISSRFRGLCGGNGKYAEAFKIVKFPHGSGMEKSDFLLRRLLVDHFTWAGGPPWPWGNQYFQN